MSPGRPQADRLRVLLTGAAGYIGSHVHRALLEAGHDVVAVDAMLDIVHGTNVAAPERVLLVDIRNPEALEPLLRGIDVVCHLAAAVPLPELPPEPQAPPDRAASDQPPIVRRSSTVQSSGVGAEHPAGDGTSAVPQANSDDGSGPRKPSAAGETGARSSVVREAGSEEGGRSTVPTARQAPGKSGRVAPVVRRGPLQMQRAAAYATHNDAGTAILLAAMERAGVRRLVLASSVAVYGEGRYRAVRSGPFFPGLRRRADLDRGLFDHRAPRTGELLTWEPLGEDAPLRPRSAYAASKVAQEQYALAWAVSTGSAATVLRYHHVYGDHADGARRVRTAETGVVARFREELIAGRAPHVFEDGGQVRDFVQVRDVATATLAAVERALPGFMPLNIGSGRPITLWEVASTMAKAVDGPSPVVTGQYRLADIRHLVASAERALQVLEFTARTEPAPGLVAYVTSGAGHH